MIYKYLIKVFIVHQLTYENNAVVGIREPIQLITLHNDLYTMREWYCVTNNNGKCLELNAVI